MAATDPATLAAQCTRDLIDVLRPAVEADGKFLQNEMQELISVPVQHVGGRIIRSKQGEAPRMETKKLRRSMTSTTRVEGGKVIAEMGSDEAVANYSKFLEGGLDRPHFATIYKRHEPTVAERVASRLPNNI